MKSKKHSHTSSLPHMIYHSDSGLLLNDAVSVITWCDPEPESLCRGFSPLHWPRILVFKRHTGVLRCCLSPVCVFQPQEQLSPPVLPMCVWPVLPCLVSITGLEACHPEEPLCQGQRDRTSELIPQLLTPRWAAWRSPSP